MGRFHVYDGLGPLRAWRTLWRQRDEFLGSEGKSPTWRVRHRAIAWLAAVVRTTLLTLRYGATRRRAGGALELPVPGDFALVRRSGTIKVLDTRAGSVATVMRGERAAAALGERLDQVRAVAGAPFAPRLLHVALDEGWFSEEWVRGRHPRGFEGCAQGFETTYLPLLAAFLRHEPPHVVPLAGYAADLVAEISSPDGLVPRLPDERAQAVRTFVARARNWLEEAARPHDAVPLVLSHGDFFSGNILVPRSGSARAIDWSHVGRRSPLFDMYFLLMNHCSRVLDPTARHERAPAMIAAMRSELTRKDAARAASLADALDERAVWRRLFYLECISIPLRYCVDPGDRYINAMMQRIQWFTEHEERIARL